MEQIGKNRVEVYVMVPPGADPHTYEPKPRQMMALSKAKLYFTVGVEFEEAKLEKILSAHPNLRRIHTDRGIAKKPVTVTSAHKHKADDPHGEGKHHQEGKGGKISTTMTGAIRTSGCRRPS
ncbi:MAG: zinc ABC transporter substrate-binding protein [Deltaproteobacteria bacterium]|nr:zinc ABC transporter substrate-binding protein [Deltaproteobacteria bacterium]